MCVCEKIRQEKKELGEKEKNMQLICCSFFNFVIMSYDFFWWYQKIDWNLTSDGSGTGNLDFREKINLRQVQLDFPSLFCQIFGIFDDF